jgi:hypothetical protein
MKEWNEGYFTAAVESASSTKYTLRDVSEILITEKIQKYTLALLKETAKGFPKALSGTYQMRIKEITEPAALLRFNKHTYEFWAGYVSALADMGREDAVEVHAYWFNKYKQELLTSIEGIRSRAERMSHSRTATEAAKKDYATTANMYEEFYAKMEATEISDILS